MKTPWQNPDLVPKGKPYLAWVNGTMLPSFWLLEKDESRKKPGKYKWTCPKTGKKVPRAWIAAVVAMPDPRDIGPDWKGL
jgi:hypothetical protein